MAQPPYPVLGEPVRSSWRDRHAHAKIVVGALVVGLFFAGAGVSFSWEMLPRCGAAGHIRRRCLGLKQILASSLYSEDPFILALLCSAMRKPEVSSDMPISICRLPDLEIMGNFRCARLNSEDNGSSVTCGLRCGASR
jgi:hypothetical protein